MDQNIGVLRLLQCTSECIYQMMRQLMNKTDGICQQQFLPVIQCQIPCCRIKGSKKFVLLKNTGTCQSVQKCGLTGIGITNNGSHRDLIPLTLLSGYFTVPLHIFQLPFEL